MKKKFIEPEAVKIEPLRQARFYGTPGLEPIGYRCGDIEIMRKLGETLDELRSRCRDSVEWPDASTVHVFMPLSKQQRQKTNPIFNKEDIQNDYR